MYTSGVEHPPIPRNPTHIHPTHTAGTPLVSKPLFSFGGHREEGFAMDWSRVQAGRLATGDNAGAIHVWQVRWGAWREGWVGGEHACVVWMVVFL